jgi:DNA-binding transcriptional ArsR family regulator
MDAVFKSLAAPSRRRILTLLREEGPMEAGEIARRIPESPRPGVSRDLRQLRECGLVKVARQGRCRVYQLVPDRLVEVRDSWFKQFDRFWEDRLSALKAFAERNDDGSD